VRIASPLLTVLKQVVEIIVKNVWRGRGGNARGEIASGVSVYVRVSEQESERERER